MSNFQFAIPNLLVALFFLYSAFMSVKCFAMTAELVKATGLPLPRVTVVLSVIWKTLASIGLFFTTTQTFSAGALVVFMLLAMYLFHAFWKKPAEERMMASLHFFSNLAIVGGLLSLAFASQ